MRGDNRATLNEDGIEYGITWTIFKSKLTRGEKCQNGGIKRSGIKIQKMDVFRQ